MSQSAYSPRRYGRSEHAPIVIDMVDYGNDDFGDDYTYASSHYSSPRHANSMQSTPHMAGIPGGGVTQLHSPAHLPVSPRHASPRHSGSQSGSRQSSPRHSSQHIRKTSSSNSHMSPRNGSSPRQSVHMHNFAQRRSFMMGGFERPQNFEQPQEVESNRVYRVETEDDAVLGYDGYHLDRSANEGIGESEYRQSPGRSRNFRQVDTRDTPTPRSVNVHRRSPANTSSFSKPISGNGSVYGSVGSANRFDPNQHLETTSTQHHVHDVHDQQGPTFPVFDRMKRPEQSVFTFDHAIDNDVHTVPGIINHPPSSDAGASQAQEANHETTSVAPPSSEKKVFYFDIDDLSQRLLNSGDQDLSRRLRKKKAKNARSRISRTRARRKSKKSVFNLELDGSTTSVLHGNDSTVTAPDQLGLTLTRDTSRGGHFSVGYFW